MLQRSHKRISNWFTIDLLMMVGSVILIAIGVLIGFDVPPLPWLLSIGPS